MISWLTNYWDSLTWSSILVSAGLFMVSVLISFVALAIAAIKIPRNYFSSHYRQDFLPDSSWIVRWGATIGKNLLGVVLIAFGIVLTLIPGPGIITILIGLIMLDIPGKRPLEFRIVKLPKVLSSINKLRKKFGKDPLIVD
jgi:hypothetical protein